MDPGPRQSKCFEVMDSLVSNGPNTLKWSPNTSISFEP